MKEFKDIFDYFAHKAFQIGLEAPRKPQYTLKEILHSSVGNFMAQALAHYLIEQSNQDLFDGKSEISAHETVSKFEKLYNLGVFLFEISFNAPAIRIDLFVWDGSEYRIITESVNNYLLETEKLEEKGQNGENYEI